MSRSHSDAGDAMNTGIYSETVPKTRDQEGRKIKNFKIQKDSPRFKTKRGKPKRSQVQKFTKGCILKTSSRPFRKTSQ